MQLLRGLPWCHPLHSTFAPWQLAGGRDAEAVKCRLDVCNRKKDRATDTAKTDETSGLPRRQRPTRNADRARRFIGPQIQARKRCHGLLVIRCRQFIHEVLRTFALRAAVAHFFLITRAKIPRQNARFRWVRKSNIAGGIPWHPPLAMLAKISPFSAGHVFRCHPVPLSEAKCPRVKC